jgi:hypothetical protein
MAAAPEKLAALRHLLAERFPTVPRTVGRVLPTGIGTIDDVAGGLPLGAVTELVCAAPSCGGQLLVAQLLAATRAHRIRVGLVDCMDRFDPGSCPPDQLAHLLWVRCHDTPQALQVTDLLARDANLGLVFLDLCDAPEVELRRIANRQWYRFQRAVEPGDLALLVKTPRAMVSSAQLRLVLDRSHGSEAFDTECPHLIAQLSPMLQRQRLQAATA